MRGERGGFGDKSAPVRVNDEMEVEIEGVGKKGDGIAKREGFVLFVPNTRKGDNVKIRVTKVLGSVGFAEVIGKTEKGSSGSEENSDGESEVSEETEESGDKEDSEEESEEDSEELEDTEDFGEEEEK